MKTLIINGAAKKNGDTQTLIDAFLSGLSGDYRIISRESGISPCTDCRCCWHTPGCSIADPMQEIYAYLGDCDNVVLASPIWFSSLSGPTLDLCSRFQTFFAGKFFRHDSIQQTMRPKNGVLLLVGAQPGTEEQPMKNAKTILHLVNVPDDKLTVVRAMHNDQRPASEDEAALRAARLAAEKLSGERGNDEGDF